MIIERIDINKFKRLHKDLLKSGFVCMQSDSPEIILDYLRNNTSVRYTRKDELLPEMKIKFQKDELDAIQLQSKVKISLTGLDIWVWQYQYEYCL